MTAIPTPALLLVGALTVIAVVLLWKVLLTAGCIGLVQWAAVTHTDDTTIQFLAFALPALLVAIVIHRAHTTRHTTPARLAVFSRREVTR